MTLDLDDRLRLHEGADFPAVAGPRSEHRPAMVFVTALRAALRYAGRLLPRLRTGRLAPRPSVFLGEDHPGGRHLRGPP